MKVRHSRAFGEWRGPGGLGSESLSTVGWSVFELWIFEVLVNPYYGRLQVGGSVGVCGVIVESSPLVMYIDVHKISFLWTVRRAVVLILSDMMQNICSHVILKEYSGWNIIFEENEKKVKLSVHDQWRVLHSDIADSGGVANLRISIVRIY